MYRKKLKEKKERQRKKETDKVEDVRRSRRIRSSTNKMKRGKETGEERKVTKAGDEQMKGR
jgi:hypothetical protein